MEGSFPASQTVLSPVTASLIGTGVLLLYPGYPFSSLLLLSFLVIRQSAYYPLLLSPINSGLLSYIPQGFYLLACLTLNAINLNGQVDYPYNYYTGLVPPGPHLCVCVLCIQALLCLSIGMCVTQMATLSVVLSSLSA